MLKALNILKAKRFGFRCHATTVYMITALVDVLYAVGPPAAVFLITGCDTRLKTGTVPLENLD